MSVTDDMWGKPAAIPTNAPPALHQLFSGHAERVRVYAPDNAEKRQEIRTKGRLLLLDVQNGKLERGVVSKITGENGQPKLQDLWTLPAVVLDGDPITEKLDGQGDRVGTYDPPLEPPFVIERLYVAQVGLIGQLEDVRSRGKRYALGVLGQLPALRAGRNKTYALLAPDAEDEAKARAYLSNKPDPFAAPY